MSQHTAPAEDFIDVTVGMLPYDIDAAHGNVARHAVVIDIGTTTQLFECVTAAGNTRTATCVTNGEQFPCLIDTITGNTTVARVRIFFDRAI